MCNFKVIAEKEDANCDSEGLEIAWEMSLYGVSLKKGAFVTLKQKDDRPPEGSPNLIVKSVCLYID